MLGKYVHVPTRSTPAPEHRADEFRADAPNRALPATLLCSPPCGRRSERPVTGAGAGSSR